MSCIAQAADASFLACSVYGQRCFVKTFSRDGASNVTKQCGNAPCHLSIAKDSTAVAHFGFTQQQLVGYRSTLSITIDQEI
jgi:hypothetical protein